MNPHSQLFVAALLENFLSSEMPKEASASLVQDLFQDLGSRLGIDGGGVTAPPLASTRQSMLAAARQVLRERIRNQPTEVNGTALVTSGRATPVRGLSGLGLPQPSPSVQRSILPQKSLDFLGTRNNAQLQFRSRYDADFDNLGCIGKGGFGEVFKVVHKLDNAIYALKKIKLKSSMLRASAADDKPWNRILSEIKTLAKLEHPNIVRYFFSWIEQGQLFPTPGASVLQPIEDDEASEPPDSIRRSADNSAHGAIEVGYSENDRVANHASSSIEFDSTSKHLSPVKIETENDTSDEGSESENTNSVFVGKSSEALVTRRKRGPASLDVPLLTLHILMSLHPMTLAEYLSFSKPKLNRPNARHCYCPLAALEIFQGILAGVEYLHAKGVVHRDLKPENVFLNLGDQMGCCVTPGYVVTPKIGDFGLVAHVDPDGTAPGQGPDLKISRVGTTFYSPPEGGKHPAVDVWALGVILFELVYKFRTVSERGFVLRDLSTARAYETRLPASLLKDIPAGIVGIIKGCCDYGPEKRLSLADIKSAVRCALSELRKSPVDGFAELSLDG